MDQLDCMRIFVRAAEVGSFSAVALEMELSQGTVSKRIASLETHLGVRLIARSSRTQSLTEAGLAYYQRCQTILSELDEADSTAKGLHATPSGTLRLSAPVVLGRLLLAPHLPDFLADYPQLKLDLLLSDDFIDLYGRGVDLAIRAQVLENSELVARPLLSNPMRLVASPEYLERHGTPSEPDDLSAHNCIIYSFDEKVNIWRFQKGDELVSVSVSGNFRCDNGDLIVSAVEAGTGLAILPVWMVNDALKTGKMIEVMPTCKPPPLPIHAVYPKSRHTPLKVRVLVDFLQERMSSVK